MVVFFSTLPFKSLNGFGAQFKTMQKHLHLYLSLYHLKQKLQQKSIENAFNRKALKMLLIQFIRSMYLITRKIVENLINLITNQLFTWEVKHRRYCSQTWKRCWKSLTNIISSLFVTTNCMFSTIPKCQPQSWVLIWEIRIQTQGNQGVVISQEYSFRPKFRSKKVCLESHVFFRIFILLSRKNFYFVGCVKISWLMLVLSNKRKSDLMGSAFSSLREVDQNANHLPQYLEYPKMHCDN